MSLENEGMEEENFAQMLEDSFKEKESANRTVEGEIVEIQEEGNRALVGVGEKSEGLLSLDEIRDEEGNLIFNKGDKITVMITGFTNERPKVSYRKVKEQQKTLEFINAHKEDYEELVVEATVRKKNKGGFILDADGVSFFMPRSLSAFKDSEDPVGKSVRAMVIKIDDSDSTIVLSRRKLFSEERKKKKELIDGLLGKDEPIDGVIKKITSYGMFVDVGGVDGLVHYNEISYKGPVNPSKLYNEGDHVQVKAISYDKEKRHLSLSIKAVQSDPWQEIENELDEGDAITVTVSNIEQYGCFVDLGNDIEGFLHISEITWDKNIRDPKEYLELGQEIDVEVIEISPKDHKLRVSLKRLLPKPFDKFVSTFKEGDVVTGTVVSLTDFGAFLKVDSVEGLLHNQDCSWEKGKKCKDLLKKGDEVEVKIGKINSDDEKISFNRKVLLKSPVEEFASSHKINDIVKGNVRDVKEFGVFVSLSDGVDALVRNEDLFPLKKEEIEASQEIEAVIVAIDAKKDRIRLSIKRLERQKEQSELEKYNDDTTHSLGDLIKDQLK